MKAHTNTVSYINTDSDEVEGICFSLIFTNGDPDYQCYLVHQTFHLLFLIIGFQSRVKSIVLFVIC
jgi:hypothetical protein